MKNIMKKTILTIALVMTCVITVKAKDANVYNGEGYSGDGGTYAGECPDLSSGLYCPYGNGPSKFRGVKISIYYINEGNFTNLKDISGKQVGPVPIYNDDKNFSSWFRDNNPDNDYANISKKIAESFGADTNGFTNIKNQGKFNDTFTKVFGVNPNNINWDKDSQPASQTKTAKYGYRIIIEPLIQFRTKDGTKYYSAKKIAALIANNTNLYTSYDVGVTQFKDIAPYLTVKVKDVGISTGSKDSCRASHPKDVRLITNGCGYNIIDVTNVITPPKCYEESKDTKNNKPLKCTNTDQNNIETYNMVYTQKNCTLKESQESKTSKYGKLIESVPGSRKDGTTCKIYCKESGTASLPGNVSSVGTLYPNGPFTENTKNGIYFAWPSKANNSKYSMTMETKYTCRIKVEGANCGEGDLRKLLEKAWDDVDKKKHSAVLIAGNNDEIHEDLKTKSETKGDSTVEGLLNGKLDYSKDETFGGWHNENDLVSKELYFTKTTHFYIEGEKNRYVSKTTGKVVKKSEGNYFDRGQGVVSFAHDTDLKTTKGIFDLKLTDLQMGSFNKTDLANNNQYVCKYRMKVDDCTCPSGTFAAGLKLYHGESTDLTDEKVKEYRDGKLTCAQLQATECSKVVCKDEDGKNQDLTDCMKEELNVSKNKKYTSKELNKAYNTCSKKKKCDSPRYCTHPKTGEKINTQDCIDERMEKGNTRSEAVIYCEKKMCNTCTDTKGDKHDISSCLDEKIKSGTTYDMALEECTVKYCPPPCKECIKECCEALTTDCKWQITANSTELVRFDKICDYSDTSKFKKTPSGKDYIGAKASCTNDCETVSFSCANGQHMKNLKACSVNGIALSNVEELKNQLQAGKLSINDISDAFNDCSAVACGGKIDTKKVVYRTIDLNTPFPSNGKTTYNDFSNIGTSRKPGSNWNSTVLVNDKILNARSAKGYELYNKEPLYVITLDSKTIKEIREYNKDNSYSDLKMNCTYKDESKCFSSFLHEKINSAITGGKCKNMEQSATGFDKCYESNN